MSFFYLTPHFTPFKEQRRMVKMMIMAQKSFNAGNNYCIISIQSGNVFRSAWACKHISFMLRWVFTGLSFTPTLYLNICTYTETGVLHVHNGLVCEITAGRNLFRFQVSALDLHFWCINTTSITFIANKLRITSRCLNADLHFKWRKNIEHCVRQHV